MFDGYKSYGEKLSKEARGGCNSNRVVRDSFIAKVTFEEDGMKRTSEVTTWRRAFQAEGAVGTKPRYGTGPGTFEGRLGNERFSREGKRFERGSES